jgi:hypothetical protein
MFFLFQKKNHKKCRKNREGHDDECGKRVGVINEEYQETPPPKEKGEKSSQFLSGYILQAPWNLGPISISFMYNLSLFGNSHSLTHCPIPPPPPLPHFLTHLQLQQQQY